MEKTNPIKVDTIGAIDPDHYKQSEIEPIAVIEAWGLNFPLGSVIKYIARHKFSGTKRKDLIKAANYCYRAATGKWLPRELQEINDGREDKTEGEGTCDVRKQRVRR